MTCFISLVVSIAVVTFFLGVDSAKRHKSETESDLYNPATKDDQLYADDVDLLETLIKSDFKIVQYFIEGKEQLLKEGSKIPRKINKYILDYERGNGRIPPQLTNETVQKIIGNPISTYRLIRRYALDLPTILDLSKASKLPSVFRLDLDSALLISKDSKWPSKNDLDFATEGILKLQRVYDISTQKFSKGKFLKVNTGARLDGIHCSEIAQQAVDLHYFALAIEWCELALEKSKKGDSSLSKVQQGEVSSLLEYAKFLHNDEHQLETSRNPWLFDKKLDLDGSDEGQSKPLNRKKRRTTLYEERRGNFSMHMAIWGVCSGDNLQSLEEKSRLFCWYEYKVHHRYLIGPLKMEFLSYDPDIALIYDFISNSSINKIMNGSKTERTLQKLTMKNIGYGSINWVWDGINNPFGLLNVAQNFQDATGLNTMDPIASDALYYKSYTWATRVTPHHDHNYVAHGMHYLTEVERGGHTAYPFLGFSIKPVKGAVVLWYNLFRDGNDDEMTRHASCPVVLGRKLIATKPIKYRAEALNYKCGLKPKERYHVIVNGKDIKRRRNKYREKMAETMFTLTENLGNINDDM